MNKELWVIEDVLVHYHFVDGKISPNHKCGPRLKLVCYNRTTKELLHSYGPFTDAEELFQWAKEHTIQLDEDLPECDHNPWITKEDYNKWLEYFEPKPSIFKRIKEYIINR